MSSISVTVPAALRGIDKVLVAIILVFGTLALTAPDQAAESLRFSVAALISVAPFLLLSVSVAAYAKASGADNLVARAFHGRTVPMIMVASLVGALSPFCSCGVIPLIAGLLAMGVPLPPVMAFWLASPVMDPSMFILTAGTLGTDLAIAKTIAAIGLGLLGGFATMLLLPTGLFEPVLRPQLSGCGCRAKTATAVKPVVWRFWGEAERRAAFLGSARQNVVFLGKWLALAFLVESLMLAYVPAEQVARAVGGEGVLPVLIATFVGIPAYLNGYAALPLVSGLMQQGMTPGAALAFLVAGGVTSIPAAMAVFAVARLPVFLAYLAYSISGALLAGLLFGLVG